MLTDQDLVAASKASDMSCTPVCFLICDIALVNSLALPDFILDVDNSSLPTPGFASSRTAPCTNDALSFVTSDRLLMAATIDS